LTQGYGKFFQIGLKIRSFKKGLAFIHPYGISIPMKRELEVRLIREDEITLWESYMREHHPLSLPKKSLPGELLRYVAILNQRWAALIASYSGWR